MTPSPDSHTRPLPLLYPSMHLAPYADRLIYGFTGKPWSFGGPDTPDNPRQGVLENRTRWHQHVCPQARDWLIPDQVHGKRLGRTGDTSAVATDGLLVLHPDHPVMLLFADCVPVILYDPDTHHGAVLHAGWRGTAQDIAAEGVRALQNAVGSRPEDLVAVIGPAIGGCCFQVSMAVVTALQETLTSTVEAMTDEGFLMWDDDAPEHPRLDLKAVNRSQLQRQGVTTIETLPECTRCETERLFSYRRGEAGRNSAYLMLLSR